MMDEEPESEVMFGGSITQLRDQALLAFNVCMGMQANLPVPPVTNTHRKYLSVAEVEAIVAEMANDIGHGYAFGASSREELMAQVHELMNALVMRIRSNILHEGVKQGYLDAIFDSEKNDFDFEVTEKGKEFNEQQFEEFWGGFNCADGCDDDTGCETENT